MARIDGRASNALRKVNITRDFLKFAEGSCLIELGNTKVICSASVDENVPAFLKNKGNGWITAEYGMLPRSCKTRIPRGKDSGRTYEIQRLVGRSLRAVTQTENMGGERTIWIDCDVIQGDGGTRTAAITGSFIALADALRKLRLNGVIQNIPLRGFVAATSVGLLGQEAVLDLCYEEDSRADVDMNIVMTGAGEFIEIQGTAERKTFSKEQMDTLLALARKGIGELVALQKSLLGNLL
ncbi:MAG: ribonuclease PH [Candidatus Omnitrophica bacterium]|nr:ribonuclease PH [Candidatus Omnitrophota bacterium]